MDALDIEIQIKEKELTILQEQLSLLKLKKQALLMSIQTPIQKGEKSSINMEANTSKTAPKTGSQTPSIQTEGKSSSPMEVNTSNPPGEDESKSKEPKVYVVYNGPNPGIYSSWQEASRAIQGIPGLVHKSFTNRIEAEGSFADYRRPKLLKPSDVISKLVLKQEQASFLSKLQTRQAGTSKMTGLGKIPQTETPLVIQEQEKEGLKKITTEQWFYLSNLIREHTDDLVDEEKFFSSDRKYPEFIHCKFNINSGVDPRLAYQIFQCGLLDNLYPGENLAELNYFPEYFRKAIRNFRRSIKAGNRPIFLRFNSSILDWGERQEIKSPYHFVRIGLASEERKSETGIVVPARDPDPKVLHLERAYTLNNIYRELRKINQDSEVKINYFTSRIIMTSFSTRKLTEEDAEKIINFEARFNSNELDVSPTTQQLFCQLAKGMEEHKCVFCAREKEELVQPLQDNEGQTAADPYLDSSEE